MKTRGSSVEITRASSLESEIVSRTTLLYHIFAIRLAYKWHDKEVKNACRNQRYRLRVLCFFQVEWEGVWLWRWPLPNPRFYMNNRFLISHLKSLRATRTCLPMLVRPRASRRLWTGLTIQLILGSRRICKRRSVRSRRQGVGILTALWLGSTKITS
jgi:hypothetical protein